jgi:hypothetical protein
LGEGLLARDDDNEYLALDGLEDEPVLQIQGYSMTYPIATGKQQGRKVFTLQTLAPIAEQGLATGCAVTYFEGSPTLGYQKKGWQ